MEEKKGLSSDLIEHLLGKNNSHRGVFGYSPFNPKPCTSTSPPPAPPKIEKSECIVNLRKCRHTVVLLGECKICEEKLW